jgi:hypothetical protein
MREKKINKLENHQRILLIRRWIRKSGIHHYFLAERVAGISPNYLSQMIRKNRTRAIPDHIFFKIEKYFKNYSL